MAELEIVDLSGAGAQAVGLARTTPRPAPSPAVGAAAVHHRARHTISAIAARFGVATQGADRERTRLVQHHFLRRADHRDPRGRERGRAERRKVPPPSHPLRHRFGSPPPHTRSSPVTRSRHSPPASGPPPRDHDRNSMGGSRSSTRGALGHSDRIRSTRARLGVTPANTNRSPMRRRNARLIIQTGQRLGVPDRARRRPGRRHAESGCATSTTAIATRSDVSSSVRAPDGVPTLNSRPDVRDGVVPSRPEQPEAGRTRACSTSPDGSPMTVAQAAQAVQISAYPMPTPSGRPAPGPGWPSTGAHRVGTGVQEALLHSNGERQHHRPDDRPSHRRPVSGALADRARGMATVYLATDLRLERRSR